jgi:hypothetical protein
MKLCHSPFNGSMAGKELLRNSRNTANKWANKSDVRAVHQDPPLSWRDVAPNAQKSRHPSDLALKMEIARDPDQCQQKNKPGNDAVVVAILLHHLGPERNWQIAEDHQS